MQSLAVIELTAGTDHITGSGDDDTILAARDCINFGDELDGGGGIDTIQLAEGATDLSALNAFQSIEVIKGTNQTETITILTDQLTDVQTIEGGGGDDHLRIVSYSLQPFDISGKSFKGIAVVELDGFCNVVTDNRGVADLMVGYEFIQDGLTLTSTSLTDAERKVYFDRGIDHITDADGRRTTAKFPELEKLTPDRVHVVSGRTTKVDVDQAVELTDLDDSAMAYLHVFGHGWDGTTILGIDTASTDVRLSNYTRPGSEVSVGGVLIGVIAMGSGPSKLDFEFNGEATVARVQELIRALTHRCELTTQYNGRSRVEIVVGDLGHRESLESVYFEVAPGVQSYDLTTGVDRLECEGLTDSISASYYDLTAGDKIRGATGIDTLNLRDGLSVRPVYNFTPLETFKSIEKIVGSFFDDTLIMEWEQIEDVVTIDGAEGDNALQLSGIAFDLRQKTISHVQKIVLTSDDAAIIVDNKTTALAMTTTKAGVHVTLKGGTFTAAQREQLLAQGIATISDDGLPPEPQPLQLSNVADDVLTIKEGDTALIDVGSDALLVDDNPLAFVTVSRFNVQQGDRFGAKTAAGKIELSQGLVEGSVVSVNGVVIGEISTYSSHMLRFAFNADANAARVQQLIRALEYTAGIYHASSSSQHDVTLLIEDENQAVTSATLIVRVEAPIVETPVDEPTPETDVAPDSILLSGSTMAELSRDGSLVGILTTHDSNSKETFRYSLLDDADGRFRIDGNQLVVAHGVKLDFEQAQTHAVVVRTTDKAGLTLDRRFDIKIADVSPEVTDGSQRDDVIIGGIGSDRLGGGKGNDRLSGRLGNDVLIGGPGEDIFVFDTKARAKKNVDKITDFNPADDGIYLDNAVFKKLGKGSFAKLGSLNKKFFKVGSKAGDGNDYVLYDRTKGILWYDADGSGKAAAVQIATLSKKIKMSALDFFVI